MKTEMESLLDNSFVVVQSLVSHFFQSHRLQFARLPRPSLSP